MIYIPTTAGIRSSKIPTTLSEAKGRELTINQAHGNMRVLIGENRKTL